MEKKAGNKPELAKTLGKGILILVLAAVVSYLLLVLVYCIPARQSTRQSAIELLQAEGWYPRALIQEDSFDEYFTSAYPDVVDNFSDSMILYLATQTPEGSVWSQAVSGYNAFYGKEYNYYWHGYVLLWRPLLYLFSYDEIRMLNLGVMLLLVFFLALLVYRKKGLGYSLLVLSGYLLLMPIAIAQNLHYTPDFYVSFGGTYLLLAREEFFRKKNRDLLFFMILGMLATFFDLLTYPLCTWGIPALWWVISGGAGRKEWNAVKRVILSGIAWIVGYGGFWLEKWLLTSLVLRKNALAEALYEVFFRAGMQEDGGLSYRLSAIFANWQHYGYAVYALILFLWLGVFLYLGLRGLKNPSPRRFALLLIGASSFVWYFVLANQTKGHHLFTYRNFLVAVSAFMALALDGMSKTPVVRQKVKQSISWGLTILLLLGAFGLMTQTKSESLTLNGEAQFGVLEFGENSILETAFTPAHKEITKLYLGLYTEATGGQYRIFVAREGVTAQALSGDESLALYSETIDIADCSADNCQAFSVDWKLNPGETYELFVCYEGMDAPVYSFTTLPAELIEDAGQALVQKEKEIQEFSLAKLDGTTQSGQLLGGVTYYAGPTSRSMQLFITMSWWMLLLSVAYVFIPMVTVSRKKDKDTL